MNSLPDDFWGRVVYLLQQYGPSFLRGAGTTMLIAVISTAVGCLIGFGVGIVQTTPTDKAHPVKYILMKLVRFLLGLSALRIQRDHFIHKRKLCILKFLLNILLDCIRVLS